MQKVDISIISSGASLADARLHRIVNALIRAGLTVEIFAPGAAVDAPTGAMIRAVHPGKGFRWRAHRAFYSPWRAEGRVLYCLAPEAQLFTWKVGLLKRRIYCADVYEDYQSLLKDRAWAKKFLTLPGKVGAAITKVATFYSSKAALTTVADIQVPPFIANDRIVLRNLPDAAHLTMSGKLAKKPRAIYIGDVRESRGLHTMLQSAELAPNWHFDIVGPISDADAAWIHLWSISHESAAARVTFHGRLSPDQSWKLAKGAWVGLSLLEPTPAFIAAVPSKIYEYMSVGLATITTPLPRSAALVEASRSGALADGPASVAKLLNSWEIKPAQLEKLRANGLTWSVKNLDAEAEYGAMVSRIQALISRSKRS
jgi:glycosyltransferase involved in cell wall biosynthesis